ncbi:hypothetical protein ACJZ2D_011885 [Fusarium nematophilum]
MVAKQEPRDTYKYRPLKPGEIRILHLHPGEIADSVFVEISHEKPDEKIKPYRAVSWEWGRQPEADVIRIKDKDEADDDDDDGSGGRGGLATCTLVVKPNLLAALKHIREEDTIERLWVDAICIDQIEQADDADEAKRKNSEKSTQISMMTKIFGTASEVSVWLGKEEDDSAKAVRFIDVLVNLEDSNHIAGLERSTFDNVESLGDGLQPLVSLLKRGWFRRRWVVQEIAMARKATLYCGSDRVDWTQLADAVAILEKVGRDGTINRALKRLATTNHVPEYIGTISSLPAYRLVQTTTGMFRGHDEERGTRTWRFTLEELVSYLAAFKAGRLHDTIYAVLGLASDFRPVRDRTAEDPESSSRVNLRRESTWGTWRRAAKQEFEVDYEKPPLLVFKEFLKRAIGNSKSLDILNRPWAPDSGIDAQGRPQRIELPSWIASLSRKPFQPTRDGRMVRFNPDPLVGPASFRHKFYTASGKKEAVFHIDVEDPESRRMTVRGFVLSTISETFDSSSFGSVPAEWLKAGGWENSGSRVPQPPSALWRTLVGDRNAVGDDPDRWYPLVFQSIAKDRGLSYGFETYRLIHESTNATVAELFRRVQAVVWDRKLIRTEGGYTKWLAKGQDRKSPELRGLGLAPSGARKGDSVCIVFGCSVPLVLRQTGQTDHPSPLAKRAISGLGTASASLASADLTALEAGSSESLPSHEAADESSHVEINTGLFTLVGEAYIDHMMDGEAMAYFQEEKSRPEGPRLFDFTLE